MDVLVLGGTGVLSEDVIGELLNHDVEVYIINRGHHKNKFVGDSHLHVMIGDVRNTEMIDGLINGKKFDCILDFLSYNPQQLESSYSHLSKNCNQYVFISSAVAFRRAKDDMPITESSPKPNYNWSYSVNKYECEKRMHSLYDVYKCPYTIVRPYITYGNTRIPFGVAPLARYHWTILGRVLYGKPFPIWEGNNLCSLFRTEDFAKLFYHLLNNMNCFNEDFNLVAEESQTWRRVVELIFDTMGQNYENIVEIPIDFFVKMLPEYKETLLGDRTLNAVFDTKKLRELVPESVDIYKKAIPLSDGIKLTVEYYRNNNYLSGIDYAYDGRIDRMLKKFLPRRDERRKSLHFNSYGMSYRKRDVIIYWCYKNLPIKLIRMFFRIYKRLTR